MYVCMYYLSTYLSMHACTYVCIHTYILYIYIFWHLIWHLYDIYSSAFLCHLLWHQRPALPTHTMQPRQWVANKISAEFQRPLALKHGNSHHNAVCPLPSWVFQEYTRSYHPFGFCLKMLKIGCVYVYIPPSPLVSLFINNVYHHFAGWNGHPKVSRNGDSSKSSQIRPFLYWNIGFGESPIT